MHDKALSLLNHRLLLGYQSISVSIQKKLIKLPAFKQGVPFLQQFLAAAQSFCVG